MSDMGQFSMHTPRWWQLASVAVASLVGSALASAADPLKLLPAGGRFDYQLGGAYPPAAAVTIVARDRGAAPAEGLYSICYVNAFQTQPEEAAWWRKNHPDLLLRTEGGGEVEDKNWQGEYLFDTSTAGNASGADGGDRPMDRRLRGKQVRGGRTGQPRFAGPAPTAS